MPKRKYMGIKEAARAVKRYRTSARRSSRFYGRVARGYTRRGGYYGRYNRPGRGTINNEMKFKDNVFGPVAMVPNGTVQESIVLISEGSGESECIGRKVIVKSILIRFTISKNEQVQATTVATLPATLALMTTNATCRVALVLDTQCNGAIAAVTDVVTPAAQGIFGLQNLANSSRFRIIKEWYANLNVETQVAAVTTGTTTALFSDKKSQYFKWYKKVNIPIEYSSNAGARVIANVKSNNLYFIYWCNTNDCIASGQIRVRYVDS